LDKAMFKIQDSFCWQIIGIGIVAPYIKIQANIQKQPARKISMFLGTKGYINQANDQPMCKNLQNK